MFEITGKILTINILSEKSAQIVLEKQIKGKKTPIAIEVFGYWKEQFDKLNLRAKDKIVGKFVMHSRLYKGRWYTDLNFREIKKWEKKPKYDFINKTYITEEKPKLVEHELFYETEASRELIIDKKTGKPKF